jgi:hypothetical protein
MQNNSVESSPRDSIWSRAAHFWPAFSAGIAALLGMGSCGHVIERYGFFAAAPTTIAIAVLSFGLLIGLGRGGPRSERVRVWPARVAALVGLTVCIAVGWWEGHWFDGATSASTWVEDDGGGAPTGAMIGGFLGIVISAGIYSIARRFWGASTDEK